MFSPVSRAGLIEGKDGIFYGTAQVGGSGLEGTVFRMDRTGVVTVLHAFDRATGAHPYAPLTQGADGFLYGTASEGGRYGSGVVFRIKPPAKPPAGSTGSKR